MNGHFGTRFLDDQGNWLSQADRYNVSADVSPTGSQMPRLVGLAQASKMYREVESLHAMTEFSTKGNEVAFGTIGNASCAEGMFWESVNAIGVLGVPAVISIWDDGFGISVPNSVQVTKSNVGELLQGFQRKPGSRDGFDVHVVRGWDYKELVKVYQVAATTAREEHVPQIVHVIEVTQPQGHSTSGSHERYKTPERMEWEKEFDCLTRMRQWIVNEKLATEKELVEIETTATKNVQDAKAAAWDAYIGPIRSEIAVVSEMYSALQQELHAGQHSEIAAAVAAEQGALLAIREPFRRDIMTSTHTVLQQTAHVQGAARTALQRWRSEYNVAIGQLYSSHLYSQSPVNLAAVQHVQPQFAADAPMVNGSEVINAFFHSAFKQHNNLVMFGEDTGKLGDVNQGAVGLQDAFGIGRVSDVGIRECTILGQAIGLGMRGIRPIAEIQYLDYLLYALQLMSDDLATVQWRTKGGQKSPVIVRTRGHRLEGVWHSGSPMAAIINLVRGMYVCVPRNFVQAAGMYNTLLQTDEPAIVVEVLNGYRLKEALPSNIGTYTVPLGQPDVVREGGHVTLITYGATVKVAMDAAGLLSKFGIECEILDVQTLLPFDVDGRIRESLAKTSRLLVVDEDMPGGTSAYIMNQVIERQGAYKLLDSPPRTLTAAAHRPAYGTDGNYWSKPEAEHIFDAVQSIMNESNPSLFPISI